MLLTLKKPVLSPLLAKELKDLAKDGINPDPAEVLWLAQLCAEAIRPNRRVASQVFALPVRCGDIYLYRPSWGSRIWFDDVCRQYMPFFSPHFKILVHGFMCYHGRNLEMFETLLTKHDIISAVTDWAKKLNVTIEELENAIDLVLDIAEETESKSIEDGMPQFIKKDRQVDYGELSAFLCHYYDVKYDEIRGLPDSVVESMIDALPVIMQAENPISGGGSSAADDRALWNLRQAVRIIRQEHAEKAAVPNG